MNLFYIYFYLFFPQNKLHYLDIDHGPHPGKIVKPPTIPPTGYANIDHFETNQ